MFYYAAGNFPQMLNPEEEELMARTILKEHDYYARLISFYYPKMALSVIRLKNVPDISPRILIMLDSGAYSAHTQAVDIDIHNYMDFINQYGWALDYYINLDVIGDGERSLANFENMKKFGYDPIPVYHATTHEKFLSA